MSTSFDLWPASQAEAKVVEAVFRSVADPSAYSAVLLDIVPTRSDLDAASTRRGTLRIGNNTVLLISSIV